MKRFIQPDPIGLAGGLNPYAYANSNPINLIDLSGLAAGKPTIQQRQATRKPPKISPPSLNKDREKLLEDISEILDQDDDGMCVLQFISVCLPGKLVCDNEDIFSCPAYPKQYASSPGNSACVCLEYGEPKATKICP